MLLIIREMQIKTTMRYYLTSVRMAMINKSTNVGDKVEKREHLCTLGLQTGVATMENSMTVP